MSVIANLPPYKTPQDAVQARIDRFGEWFVKGYIHEAKQRGYYVEDAVYTVEPSPSASWGHLSIVTLINGTVIADTALYLVMERAMEAMMAAIPVEAPKPFSGISEYPEDYEPWRVEDNTPADGRNWAGFDD